MNFLIVLTYGISLSMDAFAVAICKGLALDRVRLRDSFKVGAYFGLFQGLMPLAGYFLANGFREYIESFDHWIAFVLLLYIGGKMIWEGFHHDQDEKKNDKGLSFGNMIVMSVATSIDALAVGIAFACDGMPINNQGMLMGIYASCAIICVTTFILSAIGVKIGKIFESKLESRAELAGGIVLILLGAKILFEHLSGISIFGI